MIMLYCSVDENVASSPTVTGRVGKRVRIGSVVLGKLPIGQWRYLRPDEKF